MNHFGEGCPLFTERNLEAERISVEMAILESWRMYRRSLKWSAARLKPDQVLFMEECFNQRSTKVLVSPWVIILCP